MEVTDNLVKCWVSYQDRRLWPLVFHFLLSNYSYRLLEVIARGWTISIVYFPDTLRTLYVYATGRCSVNEGTNGTFLERQQTPGWIDSHPMTEGEVIDMWCYGRYHASRLISKFCWCCCRDGDLQNVRQVRWLVNILYFSADSTWNAGTIKYSTVEFLNDLGWRIVLTSGKHRDKSPELGFFPFICLLNTFICQLGSSKARK